MVDDVDFLGKQVHKQASAQHVWSYKNLKRHFSIIKYAEDSCKSCGTCRCQEDQFYHKSLTFVLILQSECTQRTALMDNVSNKQKKPNNYYVLILCAVKA